jgi:hypothetical protein
MCPPEKTHHKLEIAAIPPALGMAAKVSDFRTSMGRDIDVKPPVQAL